MPIDAVAASAAKVRQWMTDNKGTTSYGTCGFCWGSSVSLYMAGTRISAPHKFEWIHVSFRSLLCHFSSGPLLMAALCVKLDGS